MKWVLTFILITISFSSVALSQLIEYKSSLSSSSIKIQTAEATLHQPSTLAGPSTVGISYFDPFINRLIWLYPRNYGSFIMLYVMQRFTLPNNFSFLDSISVMINAIDTGAVRIRVIPDTLVNFGNASFHMPDFSVSYDEIVVDKSVLVFNQMNTIKMSGALVPKEFFITLEYTVIGGKNNFITVSSDARTASHRSTDDSRTIMIINNGTETQAALMDSVFTMTGGVYAYPYLYLTAYVDTATSTTTPYIVTSPVIKGYTGQPYNYSIHASGVPRPYYLLQSGPQGMTIANLTGEVKWTPSTADIGNHNVTLRAINANGYQDQTYTINVVQSTPPKITSLPKKLGLLNELYTYQVKASGGPEPTFFLTVAPTGMTVNAITGVISWIPNSSQVRDHNISVVAKNGVASDTQRFVLKIESSPSQPKITSTPKLTATTGVLYSYQVVATGNPPPIFNLTKLSGGMSIDPNSGLFTWTPDATQVGANDVTIHAENRAGTNDQSFTITVTPPQALPQITSTPPTDAVAEKMYTYNVTATGAPIPTYFLTTSPTGMTINSITGAITWTPTRAQKGNNAVNVRATNTAGSADQAFTINVKTIPKITSAAVLNAEVSRQYQYQVIADAEPTATFSLTQSSTGMAINSQTGLITWIPLDTQVGQHQVIATATNSAGNVDQQFTIAVTPAVSVESEKEAKEFYLSQNYPNPFSRHTSIGFVYRNEIKSATDDLHSAITLKVYDVLGREVLDLSNQIINNSELTIYNYQLPGSGVYFYKLTAGGIQQARMMIMN